MEQIEKQIETTRVKLEKQVQITLDEDKNVPDRHMDVEKIILTKGEPKIIESEVMVDRIRVTGVLEIKLLYLGSEREERHSVMETKVDFEEYVSMDSLLPSDYVDVVPEIEDLNITLIHSRKIGIRAIVNFFFSVMEMRHIHAISKIEEEGIESLYQNVSMTKEIVSKKDMLRWKEELVLPGNKPNIYEALWNEVKFQKVEYRIYDHKIRIQGELHVFLLYLGEEKGIPLQYVEWEVPVQEELPCYECMEEMIGDIGCALSHRKIEIKPDIDGENRMISLEIGMEADLKIYTETKMELLQDVYHWKRELMPQYEAFEFQRLVTKNAARMKLNKKISLKEHQGEILQILYMDGTCKIDEMWQVEGGIQVEGIIDGSMLYLTTDDGMPLESKSILLPFSYRLEAKQIKESDHYHIRSAIDQLSAVYVDGDEMEVRADIRFDLLVLSFEHGNAMVSLEEEEWNEDVFEQMPGVTGYLVRPGDTLWQIAKAYHTTMDEIREMNPEIGEDIKVGDRLLIVKKVEIGL